MKLLCISGSLSCWHIGHSPLGRMRRLESSRPKGKGVFKPELSKCQCGIEWACGLRVWQRQQLKKSKSASPSVRSVPAGVTHRPFHHCLVNPELTLHLVNLCFCCIFRLWEMTLWFTETFVLTLYPPAPQASDFSKCWEGKVSQMVRTLSLLSFLESPQPPTALLVPQQQHLPGPSPDLSQNYRWTQRNSSLWLPQQACHPIFSVRNGQIVESLINFRPLRSSSLLTVLSFLPHTGNCKCPNI